MPALTPPEALDLALQLHQAGRLAEAEALYRQILGVQPDHAVAAHHLGIIAHQCGRYQLAIQWIQKAINLDPNHASAHSNIGEAWRKLGHPAEAAAAYRRALALDPCHVEALINLGNALRARGQLPEAVDAYRRALALRPDSVEAHNNLGFALMDLEEFDEAIASFHQALQLKPAYYEAQFNLGIAFRGRGQLAEAIASYRQAIAIKPDFARAHMNLGNVLTETGNFDEAIAALRRSTELQPDYPDAWYDLGVAFQFLRHLDEAMDAYQRVFALRPDYVESYNNLGRVFTDAGLFDEALQQFRHAFDLQPDRAQTLSNLIFTLHLLAGQDTSRLITEEQQRWHQHFGAPAKRFHQSHPNDRSPDRRLRIGYVSADFRDHAAGRNLRPIFFHHDLDKFEIICYSEVKKPDDLTNEFRERASQWHSTVGISDEALANQIRDHRIDILVDLSQHTGDNRLPVFARRPAPLQVSFLAYPGSTGLEAIPHRLTDRWLEAADATGMKTRHSSFVIRHSSTPPESATNLQTSISDFRVAEQPFLLSSFWCSDPCGAHIPINPLPALQNGRITFGCLNNFCKINEPLLKLWARILRSVDNSQLLILADLGSHRQRTLQFLGNAGVESHRMHFVTSIPRQEYLALYHRLDLILDTFPYNGHTTSLDALWMGVPVVSLVGELPVSRAGLSQLSNLGLSELAAFSEDDYVRLAIQLARDLPRLTTLRTTLRSRLENSVLMDAKNFTRQIETAYRTMWRHRCATYPPAPTP